VRTNVLSLQNKTFLKEIYMELRFRVCLVFSLLLLASTAFAQNAVSVYWQSVGGGCVPTDLTIGNQQYWTVTGAGRVKYKGSGTQPLTFSCPVTSFNPKVAGGDGTVLRLFYQDPDGFGRAFQVKARLMSFTKSNGALATVCGVTSSKAGAWQDSTSGSCGHIDMNTKLYWVEVVIKRMKPSKQVVEFNGVSLVGLVF